MEHDTEPTEAGSTETNTVPEATGDPRVDAAIAHLVDLGEHPVSEHPPVFERIHGQLVEVLGELHHGANVADPAEPGESAQG